MRTTITLGRTTWKMTRQSHMRIRSCPFQSPRSGLAPDTAGHDSRRVITASNRTRIVIGRLATSARASLAMTTWIAALPNIG